MSKNILNLLLLYVILVPAQALVFNNLVLFDVAVPVVFIYMLITLPVTFSANLSMTIGFLTGLSVDILSDTPGLNALACTVMTFVRRPVFHLYVPDDNDLAEQGPSIRNMGTPAFLKYIMTMIVIYSLVIFTVEAFRIFNLRLYLLRIGASSLYSFIMVYALAYLTSNRREKRL